MQSEPGILGLQAGEDVKLKHSGAAPFNLGMEDDFTFAVPVPGGLPRYGIQVGGTGHGTVWESAAQMKAGPALSVDETTGSL